MSFFRTARNAAADQYGRNRAESYGRRARAGRWLVALAAVVLLFLIVSAAQGSLGG